MGQTLRRRRRELQQADQPPCVGHGELFLARDHELSPWLPYLPEEYKRREVNYWTCLKKPVTLSA